MTENINKPILWEILRLEWQSTHMIVTGNINNPILWEIFGIECQSMHMIANETLNYPIHDILRRIDHVQLLDR